MAANRAALMCCFREVRVFFLQPRALSGAAADLVSR
jgi:hypothetical protein